MITCKYSRLNRNKEGVWSVKKSSRKKTLDKLSVELLSKTVEHSRQIQFTFRFIVAYSKAFFAKYCNFFKKHSQQSSGYFFVFVVLGYRNITQTNMVCRIARCRFIANNAYYFRGIFIYANQIISVLHKEIFVSTATQLVCIEMLYFFTLQMGLRFVRINEFHNNT